MDPEFHTANEIDDIEQLERRLQRLLPGPLVTKMNGFETGSDVYLAHSWLNVIHSVVVRQQEGIPRQHCLTEPSKRQLAVAICNRLELDAEVVLEAEPQKEVEIFYEAMIDLLQVNVDGERIY
jgi:hypothetical protein